MATVTDIRDMRGVIGIYADGTLIMRVAKKHFEKMKLRVGDEFEPEDYADSVAAIQLNDAYEFALTCLDFCQRSAAELTRKLISRGYVAPAAEAAVARLIEVGIIDDARYARRIAETASRKNVGIYAMKRKLMSKGFSEEDTENALEALDDAQQLAACCAAADKLRPKYAALPAREARMKLSQALARRGFGWDTISQALDDGEFFE